MFRVCEQALVKDLENESRLCDALKSAIDANELVALEAAVQDARTHKLKVRIDREAHITSCVQFLVMVTTLLCFAQKI